MINIAMVEDEDDAAEKLLSYLGMYKERSGQDLHVQRFANPIHFLTGYTANYDLVLMDIELPDFDGMEVSRKLREIDKSVVLIFVTNMAQYAVVGYGVDAFDYIVKPVSYSDFALKLDRAMERIKRRMEETRIRIAVDDATMLISAGELMYAEVSNHKLIYHTTGKVYEATGSLKGLEKRLARPDFVKCNNCYLVNLRYVTGFKGFTVTVGGDELQISRPKRKEFLRALNNYLGENF